MYLNNVTMVRVQKIHENVSRISSVAGIWHSCSQLYTDEYVYNGLVPISPHMTPKHDIMVSIPFQISRSSFFGDVIVGDSFFQILFGAILGLVKHCCVIIHSQFDIHS